MMPTDAMYFLVIRRYGRVRILAVTQDTGSHFRAYELPRRTFVHGWMGSEVARRCLLMKESFLARKGGRWVAKRSIFPGSVVMYWLRGIPQRKRFATRESAVRAANRWIETELNLYNAVNALGRTPFAAGPSFGWVE